MNANPILVPIDFTPHSERALSKALELAIPFGAPLHLLHVREGEADLESVRRETEKLLALLLPSQELQTKS